jgi:hypothetical protein
MASFVPRAVIVFPLDVGKRFARLITHALRDAQEIDIFAKIERLAELQQGILSLGGTSPAQSTHAGPSPRSA